jgi:hypothetical protein
MSSYLYVNYTPVSTPIAVPAIRGAQDFLAADVLRGNDNLSTSGAVRERVGDLDVMVSFTLPGLLVAVDYDAWATFAAWALAGGTFTLAPNYALSEKIYNCVLEDQSFELQRLGMKRYTAKFKMRILNDGSRPANASEVMKSFWGLV